MESETLVARKTGNETLSTIYSRRAVRKYKDQPVEKDLVDQILAAGRMAPSAMNRQPWKFYVVTNKEIIHTLSGDISKKAFKDTLKKGVRGIMKTLSTMSHFVQSFRFSALHDPVFYGAPVVIFITSPKENEWAGLDIGACAQNMMLAAKSLGLDSCPVGFAKFVEHTHHYSLLHIPEHETVQIAVILGYGDEQPQMHERFTGNVFYIE